MSSTKTWWPEWAKQGLQDALPFIVITITLFVLGRSIPMRGEDTRSSLPPVILPRNRPLVIALLTVAGVVLLSVTSGSYRFGIITSLASSLIALSLVILTGMVGQISLAQAAFAGVAGLVLTKVGDDVPFPLSLLLAAVGRRGRRRRGRSPRAPDPRCPTGGRDAGRRADAGEVRLREPADPRTDPEPDPEPTAVRHRPRHPEGSRHRPRAVRDHGPRRRRDRVRARRQPDARRQRPQDAGRALERAGGGLDRHQRVGYQARHVRLRVVPRRPRRRPHRLQPRPALARVVRRVRRAQLPRHRLPRRDHQRQRRARRRRAVGARDRVRDLRPQPRPRRVLRPVQRPLPAPHRAAQPRRHRRQDAAPTSTRCSPSAGPSAGSWRRSRRSARTSASPTRPSSCRPRRRGPSATSCCPPTASPSRTAGCAPSTTSTSRFGPARSSG